MIVAKFGGTSLADATQIRRVVDIVLSNRARRVLVVSAPGKRYSDDLKVTDLLIALASAIQGGYDGISEMAKIAKRYDQIARDLGLGSAYFEIVMDDLKARIAKYKSNHKDLNDALKAAGEDNNARLIAAYINSIGEKASYINPLEAGMLLKAQRGQTIVLDKTYEELAKLDTQSGLLVFPGFFGGTEDGRIITFSRGGSDITGAILAVAMKAEAYENWTDVDSVFAVNPNLVKEPRAIREITYNEMRELAYAGFSVLHEEAVAPTYHHDIPIHIRNTNNPGAAGTKIVKSHGDIDSIVTGIAGQKGFSLLHVSKFLMNREVGFAMKVLQILADYDISFDHMPSGIDSLSIVFKQNVFTKEKEKLVCQRLKDELEVDVLEVDHNLGIVMIVGDAMAKTVGVTARATSALAKAGINIELISQGASEISIVFGVREEFVNYAVRELYREFF